MKRRKRKGLFCRAPYTGPRLVLVWGQSARTMLVVDSVDSVDAAFETVRASCKGRAGA